MIPRTKSGYREILHLKIPIVMFRDILKVGLCTGTSAAFVEI